MSVIRVALSEVAQIDPRADHNKKPGPADLVTFVPMASVSEHTLRIETPIDRPYSEVAKGYTNFERGDVIIAKITPCFENGKMAFTGDLPRPVGIGSTEFHIIRPTPKIRGAYLFHLLRFPNIKADGARKMQGAAGQRRVHAGFFESLQIPLPPLAEQKRIAAILDAADALRAKRREALAQLDALLQSTFLTLFGDPRKQDTVGEIATAPKTLGELTRIRTGKLDANAADDDGAYPFFTCAVKPLRINTPEFDCKAVLVAGNGDLNVKYYEGKFNAYQRTYVIESLREDHLEPRFLFAFLDLYVSELRKQAIGGVIKYIKLPYLTDAVMQLPSMKEHPAQGERGVRNWMLTRWISTLPCSTPEFGLAWSRPNRRSHSGQPPSAIRPWLPVS